MPRSPHHFFSFRSSPSGKGELFRSRLKGSLWIWTAGTGAMFFLTALEDLVRQGWNLPLLIGSFGATAVLLYGAPQSPLAQPRNVIGGHVVSALIGVVTFQMLGACGLLAPSLAVSTAIVAMRLTGTLHPPGGATALLAVIGGDGIHQLGYWYALVPCGAGAVVMVGTAVAAYRLAGNGVYPVRG